MQVHDHEGSALNNNISIDAGARDPACGNGSHDYRLSVMEGDGDIEPRKIKYELDIHFQHGALKEAGLNGISDEALLAVVLDRLRGFQEGEFRCRENALAITKIEEGLHWLRHRTLDRQRRGVEGYHKA